MEHKFVREELEKVEFVPINVHSHFSIPFGVGKVKDHFKRCQKLGFKGFSLTDVGSMAGCLEAVKLSKEAKFPLIIGCELNIIDSLENRDKANRYFNITCLVKDFAGYSNLVRLISNSGKEDHMYFKPRISLEELIAHKEGLIITSGNIFGMISQSIIKETGQEELLTEIFKEHFGDDFYMQINYHSRNMEFDYPSKKHKDTGFDPQEIVNKRLFELAKLYDVKTFITQNSYLPEEKHKLQQNILLGNNEAYKRSEYIEYHSFYLKDVPDMYEEVKKMAPYISDERFLEMCATTVEMLNKCKDLQLRFKPELPLIKYEEIDVNMDNKYEDMFVETRDKIKSIDDNMYDLFLISERDIALKSTIKIILRNNKFDFFDPKYASRLAYELRVIQRNGVIQLLDYFLLLEDVTFFVRQAGFLRGMGRGSGAGSLLSYAVDITDCDPLEYDLLFERFLTKERIGKYLIDHPEFPLDKLKSLNDITE